MLFDRADGSLRICLCDAYSGISARHISFLFGPSSLFNDAGEMEVIVVVFVDVDVDGEEIEEVARGDAILTLGSGSVSVLTPRSK